LPPNSDLYDKNPLLIRGVVSLAGITDLGKFRPNCRAAVTKLLGGSPEEVAERYQQTSPIELLPLGVEQHLILGAVDVIVPAELGTSYQSAARKKGDLVDLTSIAGAGHFDLIAPQSLAWPAIQQAIRSLLKLRETTITRD
jgi:pimeloyl-ACP methyl ester carboxylesterase